MSHNSGGGGQLFQVKQELFKAFQIQFQNLKEINSKIVFGLTGGLDSGVSFYATREFNSDSFYFTWASDDDIEQAYRIAKEYDLNWISLATLSCGSNSRLETSKKVIQNRSGFNFLALNLFPGQWIHIHSTLHETARGRDWERSPYSIKNFLKEQRVATVKLLPENDQVWIDLATKYFEKLNHQEVTKLGYNPWDFAYLENRNGGWLSRIGDVMNPFAEPISLANCRHVFEIMWQVPSEYINKSSLLYNCIMNEHDTRHREESFMYRSNIREVTMGKNFKPSPKDYDNYALVYGGYLLKGDPIEIAKRALEINPTIEWAIRALQQNQKSEVGVQN